LRGSQPAATIRAAGASRYNPAQPDRSRDVRETGFLMLSRWRRLHAGAPPRRSIHPFELAAKKRA